MKSQPSRTLQCSASGFAALAAATLISAPASAGLVVIDDFSSVDAPATWPVTLDAVGTDVVTETGLAGVMGGERVTTIDGTQFVNPGLDNLRVTIDPVLSAFDLASSAGAEGTTTLGYGINTPLDADFSEDLGVQLDLLGFDNANNVPLPITLTLTDGVGSSSDVQVLMTQGAQSLQFDFGDFGGVDLSDIDTVEIEFAGALGTDLRLTQVATYIPAPGALAMLGLGGLVIGRRRRRR